MAPTWISRAGEHLLLVWRFATFERRQAERVYALLDRRLVFGERTCYLNLGWWDGATTFDDASDALAEQLGLAVAMRAGDTVVDVGFGFGDQDEYWLRRFGPRRIIGLNTTPLHVEAARERFPDPRLDFRLGSATAMDIEDGSVDRVTALECAFHFPTREVFFREAFRVLRAGGRLATSDILPTPGRHRLAVRLNTAATKAFWQVPRQNWYGIDEYRCKLEHAGFVDVEVRSVRERVIVPFWHGLRRMLRSPAAAKRWNPLLRQAARIPVSLWDGLDYVIASARKPG